MSYKDKYRKLKSLTGNSIRESKINSTKNFYISGFEDHPSWEEVLVQPHNSPTPIEGTLSTRIVYNGKNPYIKTLLIHPNQRSSAGDILIRENQEKWLNEFLDYNPIYYSATIEKCNHDLNWIDDRGDTKSYPAVVHGSTSLGVDEDNILNIPDGQREILVQYNQDTTKIKRDDRFILGNEAFKVIDYDFVTQPGILKLSFKSEGINILDDNLELRIANYWSRQNKVEIILAEQNPIKLGINQNLKIDFRTVDKNGEIFVPVKFTSENPEIISVDNEGIITGKSFGYVNIKIETSAQIQNQAQINFLVECFSEVEEQNINIEILGSDYIIYGKTSVYQANYLVNDERKNETLIFSLENEFGSKTEMASIINFNPNSNECTVKAIPFSKMAGNIYLIASNIQGDLLKKKKIRILSSMAQKEGVHYQ